MVETTKRNDPKGEQPRDPARLAALGIVAIVACVFLASVAFIAARLVAGGGGDDWDVEAGLPVEVAIAPGTSASAIYATLDDLGVARASALADAARSLDVENSLKAGSYAFVTDMPPEDVIRRLAIGPNLESGSVFTLVEGWTIERIVTELSEATGFTTEEFDSVLRGDAITSPLLPPVGGPIDGLNRWEGLLFPATYQIPDGSTPASVLGMMADEMARRVETVDWSRLDALGVSRYEAITVASLIEREAGNDEERPTIASVIYNRLAEPMRLQIDATVIYALGYNPGRVTAEHLAVDSPWNTYRVDGLPPTPIGTTSMASLAAAADPARTDYLYYVLGSQDGSHLFAETYEEHQANIERARETGVRP
jgi:peptidoglycan lytic transglycosylase G